MGEIYHLWSIEELFMVELLVHETILFGYHITHNAPILAVRPGNQGRI